MAGGGRLTDLWGKPMLVEVTGHWIAVRQGMVVDSGLGAGSEPIPLKEYAKGRSRVKMAWCANRFYKKLKQEPMPMPETETHDQPQSEAWRRAFRL